MILKFTQYSVVQLVNLLWTSNVLHYHKPQSTNNMSISIPLLSVILLKMTLVNIIVISVKKNTTQNISSTIMQIAIILYIPNVFLGKIQISSNTYDGHLFGGVNTFNYHPHTLTFIEGIIDYPRCNRCNSSCKELIYQCAQCSFHVHYYCSVIIYRKDKCSNFYSILYLVHEIFLHC